MQTSLFNKAPRIDEWFPIPIYVRDKFEKANIDEIRDWLLEMFILNAEFKRTPELNVNTTHMVNNLAVEPFFADLVRKLNVEILGFAKAMGYGELLDRVKIQNMWANISERGDYLFPHNHPSSFISGAFYVDCGSEEDVIRFYRNPQSMIAPSPEPNRISYDFAEYQCIPGRLLLFRSEVMHGCPRLVGERKIVISFNYGIY